MSRDFVEGWTIVQTLGEGAFGEVQLVVNKSTQEAVAMKVIDLKKHREAKSSARKEVTIQRILSNPHIIKCYGQRFENDVGYIFLEYAPGGELFDRIEPDVGMPVADAQKYFKQLLSGLEYLHARGVAHRDLKPENLLLDNNDNLKISDFGMATVFHYDGQERPLEKQCGTLPYVAPEVLLRPYAARPADIWSCGIILVAMLAGELPWDKPTLDSKDYVAWKDGLYVNQTPWSKLDNLALSLIRKILIPLPSSRYTVSKIKKTRWFCKRFQKPDDDGPKSPMLCCKRMKLSHPSSADSENFSYSQPDPPALLNTDEVDAGADDWSSNLFSFSQPADLDDLLVSTQLLSTQTCSSSQNSLQKLVRRMTRFFVTVNPEDAMKHLTSALDKIELSWKKNENAAGVVTITTVDRRKCNLIFKASVLNMDRETLLDFRLSKGCGIEFKRRFIMIRKSMIKFIQK